MTDTFKDRSKEIANRVNDLIRELGENGNSPREIVSGTLAAITIYGMVTAPSEFSHEETKARLMATTGSYCDQFKLIMSDEDAFEEFKQTLSTRQ